MIDLTIRHQSRGSIISSDPSLSRTTPQMEQFATRSNTGVLGYPARYIRRNPSRRSVVLTNEALLLQGRGACGRSPSCRVDRVSRSACPKCWGSRLVVREGHTTIDGNTISENFLLFLEPER